MRRTTLFACQLALGLSCFTLACGSDDTGGFSTFNTTVAMETTGDGDGDGDPGDGDPGDGDGDPGDGDGDTGDGDGDGDTGDGDGDTGDGDGDGDGDLCGNAVVDPGEECDVGVESMFCDGDCTYAMCGDGYHNMLSEQCDDGNGANDDGCVGACQLNVCGDGVMWLGMEDCDDGNMIDTDECKSDCTAAFCGDGVIQDEVEQCEDLNMVDDDACTNACQDAVCGDGILWVDMEVCDDGNFDNSDMCPGSCAPAFCGDGFTQANLEQCDDGNNVDNDGCTNNCISLSKRVFVSSVMYDGNLGGLVGADAKCQALADAANLPGTFMAWISTNQGSPSTRFTQSITSYTLVDGTQVAANWASLIDGTLDSPIDMTETGGVPPIGDTTCAGGGFTTVWSATSTNGTLGGNACNNFTSTVGSGLWGQATVTNSSWTSWCSGGVCTWNSPIYCFQQ